MSRVCENCGDPNVAGAPWWLDSMLTHMLLCETCIKDFSYINHRHVPADPETTKQKRIEALKKARAARKQMKETKSQEKLAKENLEKTT